MNGSVKHFFLIVCLVLVTTGLMAQGKWYNRGQRAFEKKDYPEALRLFAYSAEKDPTYKSAVAAALTCHKLRNFSDAAEWYRKALVDPNAPAEVHYRYGKSLMNNGRYQQAAMEFMEFITQAPADPRAQRYIGIQTQLERLLSDSASAETERLPINSQQSDFSAFPYGEGIIFASARKADLAIVHVSFVDGAPLLDLYTSQMDTSGKWSKPKPLKGDINSKFNEGPAIFDDRDSVLIFTRNFFQKAKGQKKATTSELNKLKLLSAELKNGEWKTIDNFPFNDNAYAVGHPTLSPNGQTLIFSSDMPGGFGGVDLWQVMKVDSGWSQPVNLGNRINTEGDEMFPFISADGTLYFSSDDYFGLGGLDVFKSRKVFDEWSTPTNLGAPINSNADDFGYYLFPDRKHGYLSSNRGAKQGKNDDIYAFRLLIPEFECAPQEINYYCYRFFEPDTVDVSSLAVIYEWDFGDGNRATGLEAIHCYPGEGTYEVKLNLIDTISGYLFMNQSIRVMDVRNVEQVFIDSPDTVMVGDEITLSGLRSILPGWPDATITDYYWNIEGSWRTGEEILHAFTQPGTYEVMLGVIARSEFSPDEIKECVTKPITVLSRESYLRYQDSLQKSLQKVPKIDPLLGMVDSIKAAREHEMMVQNIADSTGKVYSVQIFQTSDSIGTVAPDIDPTIKEDVRIVKQDDKLNYLVGETPDIKEIEPIFRDLKDKGFVNAIVVALKNDQIISGNDSTFYLRDPDTETTYAITLLKGSLIDSLGNPLMGEITLEDLEAGITIQKTPTKNGKFALRLPSGKIYGYVAKVEGYFPYSNYIDLRPTSGVKTDVVIQDEIKLLTIRQIIDQGVPVRINNVFFDFDSDRLRPESKLELNRLLRLLGEHPTLDVEIMGHTDWVGAADYNLDLSDRRAKSVLRYLILNGTQTDKITAHGYGEARPIAPNTSPEGRQLNRRVEFRFIPKTN